MFYYALLFKAKQRFAYLLLTQSVYLFLNVLFLFWSVFHFYVFVSIRYQNNLISKLYYRRTCIIIDIFTYSILILYILTVHMTIYQGWEFAHWISKRIALFLPKNERMSDLLKAMSDSLIRSFLMSDLSDSLMIAHFLWANWANHSWLLIFGEQPERYANITHLIWAKWAIHSQCSPNKRKWAKMSNLLIFSVIFFFLHI